MTLQRAPHATLAGKNAQTTLALDGPNGKLRSVFRLLDG